MSATALTPSDLREMFARAETAEQFALAVGIETALLGGPLYCPTCSVQIAGRSDREVADTAPRIITIPLSDDLLPVLTYGDNWLAYYEDARPGDVRCGRGNTEAQAVSDLLTHHPIENAEAA